MSETPVPAITRAIKAAFEEAEELHASECRRAATWTMRWGRHFLDKDFEDHLLAFERLTDHDRHALRELRADLIERADEHRQAA